jgi:hypothetical protein
MSLPKVYRLDEAAALLGERVTVANLRTEIRAGRLQVVRIAGRFFVTESGLAAMLSAAAVPARSPPWPDADCQRACASDQPEKIEQPPGQSSTDRVSLALAAAQMTVRELKKRSSGTLPEATDRQVVRIGRVNS